MQYILGWAAMTLVLGHKDETCWTKILRDVWNATQAVFHNLTMEKEGPHTIQNITTTHTPPPPPPPSGTAMKTNGTDRGALTLLGVLSRWRCGKQIMCLCDVLKSGRIFQLFEKLNIIWINLKLIENKKIDITIINNWTKNNESNIEECYSTEETEKNIVVISGCSRLATDFSLSVTSPCGSHICVCSICFPLTPTARLRQLEPNGKPQQTAVNTIYCCVASNLKASRNLFLKAKHSFIYWLICLQ